MKYDLQDRPENFAVTIIRIVDHLPDTPAGKLLTGQFLRSGTSPALHYGEAQGAASKKEFIHKMRNGLKELRETRICLNIIFKAEIFPTIDDLPSARMECNELIAIHQASVKTAEVGRNADR